MSSRAESGSSVPFDELLQAAREGNAEAQGGLLEACRRPLLHLARKQLGSRVAAKGGASDVVQEAFLKALHDIRTFQGCTPEQLLAWLSSIVCHTATNFEQQFSSAKRNVERETAGVSEQLAADPRRAAASANEEFFRREQIAQVQEILSRLPEDHAQVPRLHFHEGLSFEQIGAKLGRSAEAARKLFIRAMGEVGRIILDGGASSESLS